MKNKILSIVAEKYNTKDLHVIKQIIVFYTVGIVGFLLPFSRSFFTKLTPLALILSTVLLIYYNENKFDKKTSLYFIFVFIVSFFIEVIGVQTGKLFGNYHYGSGLGIKLIETPVLIGLNWALLVYLSSAIFNNKSTNIFYQIIFTSTIMLFYDIILEPSASKMDMWFWKENNIPLQNFMMWGAVAIIFNTVKFTLKIEIKNKMALPLILIQMLFFFIIQIL